MLDYDSLPPALDLVKSTDQTRLARQLPSLIPDASSLNLVTRLMLCLKLLNDDWDLPECPCFSVFLLGLARGRYRHRLTLRFAASVGPWWTAFPERHYNVLVRKSQRLSIQRSVLFLLVNRLLDFRSGQYTLLLHPRNFLLHNTLTSCMCQWYTR